MQKLNVESDLAQKSVNTLRLLSVDMVEKANSGHPGMPCGAADAAFVLWTKFMRYDAKKPSWPNRDRFVLSAGHGSTLLYSLLHLCGNEELTMDELKSFRQWGSKTPGHPEHNIACGIESTTGPLGQGIGNAVGMAIAAKMMAARFNQPEFELINCRVCGIVGDGDLMEGISHEASSLAGHLGLGNLILIYDDNEITIEGKASLACSDNVKMRFESYGWHTVSVDGHNRKAIERALDEAAVVTDRPSIIIARTIIGFGAPTKAGSHTSHGEPLGAAEVSAMKQAAGWPEGANFYVPDDVRTLFAEVQEESQKQSAAWESMFGQYKAKYPELAAEWEAVWNKAVPEDITDRLLGSIDITKEMATRESGGLVLQEVAKLIPSVVGGSADLAPSTKTWIKDAGVIDKTDFSGKNFHFGIREHAMGSIMNGLACFGGFIPFGSTFLIFSDYARPTIRIAALNGNQEVYVFTHDSIFVGEDGPTHQPIEQLPSLRCIPNVTVIRPADAAETAVAWAAAMKNTTGPTVLALSRQKLAPLSAENPLIAKGAERGAYVVSDVPMNEMVAIIIASGSEVQTALGAQKLLAEDGFLVRVVSMPSMELFEEQSDDYKESVLPTEMDARIAVEASANFGWERYTGTFGMVLGMERFGASAPASRVSEEFGFTAEWVRQEVKYYLDDGCCCDCSCEDDHL